MPSQWQIDQCIGHGWGKSKNFTGSTMVVLTAQGATVLIRMPSFAHSHAKFLVTWFIAPKLTIINFGGKKCEYSSKEIVVIYICRYKHRQAYIYLWMQRRQRSWEGPWRRRRRRWRRCSLRQTLLKVGEQVGTSGKATRGSCSKCSNSLLPCGLVHLSAPPWLHCSPYRIFTAKKEEKKWPQSSGIGY